MSLLTVVIRRSKFMSIFHFHQSNQKYLSLLKRSIISLSVIIFCMAFSAGAWANITISYNFNGSWNDDQKAAMNNAASHFSNLFGSYFSNSGIITLDATAYNSENENLLASAGSSVVHNGSGTFGYGEVIRNILQNGTDLNGAAADGAVNVNFYYFTELDYNDPVPSGTYDFYSTLYHEFTHALGFSSLIDEYGNPMFGNWGDGTGEWAAYDKFLVDINGSRIVGDDYILDGDLWDDASADGSSMYFNGANAVAANGGDLVHLYSPAIWEGGSSISHLDDDTYSDQLLMLAYADDGENARDYSALEIGMLADLGYTAVPIPGAFILMLSGLTGIGGLRRLFFRHCAK